MDLRQTRERRNTLSSNRKIISADLSNGPRELVSNTQGPSPATLRKRVGLFRGQSPLPTLGPRNLVLHASKLRLDGRLRPHQPSHRLAPNPFRPTWINVTITLIVAVPLQIAGFFLGIMNSCFDGGTDCAAYSAVGTAIARAMAWPVFVVENFTRSTHADDYLWWFSTPLQWADCYLLLAIGRAAVHTFREANGR